MKPDYASYEKIVSSKIVFIKHIVRIRKKDSLFSIKETLKNVPYILLDDFEDFEDYFELYFIERVRVGNEVTND